MANRYKTESTLSDHGQTVIPSIIRKYLSLEGGGKIEYEIDEQGQVVVRPKLELESDNNDTDPALRPFLTLIEKDIQKN